MDQDKPASQATFREHLASEICKAWIADHENVAMTIRACPTHAGFVNTIADRSVSIADALIERLKERKG